MYRLYPPHLLYLPYFIIPSTYEEEEQKTKEKIINASCWRGVINHRTGKYDIPGIHIIRDNKFNENRFINKKNHSHFIVI